MNRSAAGREGEALAASFLERQGLRILARNFRSHRGEIDLIALDGETLVFVEVKAWAAIPFSELDKALGPTKRRRIIETAKFFLSLHREYNCVPVRFDVVFVSGDGVRHLASAFTECV